jgi:hypothetical protein
MIREEYRELDVEGASDKPRKSCERERDYLRHCKRFLFISCLGTGVDRVIRMNDFETMVGCKGEHP